MTAGGKQISSSDPALISLCSKAVNLTNNINTHLSDHAETQEAQNEIQRSFTAKFNRLREILCQIQAGLSRLTHGDIFVPYEASQILSMKLQHTVRDLVSSDLLVVKLISNSRKTGFGKFMKGFKQASLDAEISVLGDSLGRHREALRTGWAAFSEVLSKGDQPNVFLHTSDLRSERSNVDIDSLPASLSALTLTHADTKGAYTFPSTFTNDGPGAQMPVAIRSPQRKNSRDDMSRVPTQRTYSDKSLTFNEPATPRPGEQDLGRPKIWSGDRAESVDSFSRNSSFRLNLVKRPPSPYPTPLTDPEPWVSSGPTSGKAALTMALQNQDHKKLQQLLRDFSTGGLIPPGLLSQAVGSNDVSSVRLLLTHGVPVNRTDDDGNSALLVAVATWSIDMARLLLENGADPNFGPSDSDMSPFSLAARQNQVELVQLMLEHGADVNSPLSNGDTPINACMCHGVRSQIVETLLIAGANPNQKTRNGKTPLIEALTMHRVDLVRLLLDHGANPNLAGPKHPLWPATYLPEALKLLIERGAKPKMASGNMELAASINSIESVQILLDAGVSPNLKKDGVYTPLCSAIRDDKDHIVALLLGSGADPNLPASEYPAWKCITHNRLHYLPSLLAAGADLCSPPGIAELAVAHNNKDALMYVLLNGVDANAANEEGRTALTTAIRDNRVQLLDMLLAHGARVTARGEDWPLCMALKNPPLLKRLLSHTENTKGMTKGIIELAVQANQLESVKMLVEAGINVEDRTGGVFSPLTSAIRENRKPIVRYLVDEAGADVNSPGEHLPLIKAIRRRTVPDDNEIIEYLLSRGADINLIYRGWNAIMQAVEKGDKKLLHLLVEKGNGIDLEVIDSDSGQTVYEMICDRGWSDGIGLLMENRHQVRMVTEGSKIKA